MNGLTFSRLHDTSLARCQRWHPGGIHDWSLSDWGVALVGEIGEACNIIKKLNRERDGIAGNQELSSELRDKLSDELADSLIYLDLLASAAGVDLEKAVVDKFNSVSVKMGFPDRL